MLVVYNWLLVVQRFSRCCYFDHGRGSWKFNIIQGGTKFN
jgi:hypothetical protein